MREEYLADLVDGGEIVRREFSDGHGHGEMLYLAEILPVNGLDAQGSQTGFERQTILTSLTSV